MMASKVGGLLGALEKGPAPDNRREISVLRDGTSKTNSYHLEYE